MNKWSLTIYRKGLVLTHKTFTSQADAHAAVDAMCILSPMDEWTYEVREQCNVLAGYTFDDADMMVMRECYRHNSKVTAIKFARMKAKCSLRDAKDYCDSIAY